jgi:hypothetical protein
MLRQLVSKQAYMVIMTIGCLLLSALSSAENALCLEIGDVSVDVPMELSSCHLSSKADCASAFIQEQRNSPGEKDCQVCFDFTYQDIVLTGIFDRDITADLPPVTISLVTQLPRLSYAPVVNPTYLRRNMFFLPPFAAEKSIKSTVLII